MEKPVGHRQSLRLGTTSYKFKSALDIAVAFSLALLLVPCMLAFVARTMSSGLKAFHPVFKTGP